MTTPQRQRRVLGVVAPSVDAVPVSWTLIVNGYCHLCDDMRRALAPYLQRADFALQEWDIDEHPELEARWGEKVPVLLYGDVEVCFYHLDVARLEALLAGENMS